MKLRFAGEFAWVLAGKAVAFIGSILLIKILTHSMNVEAYAQLMLGLTLCNFFTQLLMGAIGQGVGRVYVDAVENNENSAFGAALFKLNKKILAIYALTIFLLFIVFFYMGDIKFFVLVSGLVVYSYINGLNDISAGLHNLARNRAIASIGPSFDSLLKIALIYSILAIIKDLIPEYVVYAYILSATIVLFYQVKSYKNLNLKFDQLLLKHDKWIDGILRIALPASFWGLFVWLQQASDKWALKLFANEDSVAQYAVIYQIGYAPFLMGVGVVMAFLIPMIYKKSQNNIIRNMLIFVGVLTAFSFIVVQQYYAEIVSVVVSAEYQKAAHFIPYMILAAGFYQMGDVFSVQLMRENRPKTLLKIKIFSSLICLMTNMIGAYLYGLSGVVASMVLFGFLYFISFVSVSLFGIKTGENHVT
jgi:O-antigen/teichoic acid export membrane protein